MALLAADLGGTKLALAVFSEAGEILLEERVQIGARSGEEVATMICEQFRDLTSKHQISGAGICVPGIYRKKTGSVWAPNIQGWTDYPLLVELRKTMGDTPIHIDSDRACYILGEHWKGAAQGCDDAIYLAVGTGIGAGIMAGGQILRGAHDIAGAIGWMALERPFQSEFVSSGCFESYASGKGMAAQAQALIANDLHDHGTLIETASAAEIFHAHESGDPIAGKIIASCIELWGMAVANLISLYDPEKIIMGGGVFGPATRFIPDIITEASRWAQPVSMKMVQVEASQLGDKAGLYGAGLMALQNRKQETGVQ